MKFVLTLIIFILNNGNFNALSIFYNDVTKQRRSVRNVWIEIAEYAWTKKNEVLRKHLYENERKKGKGQKGGEKGEEGKKIQVRERFSALTIFHFSETSARRFIRFSSIEPRNTFRHRGDQKNDETISKEKEKKEEGTKYGKIYFRKFPDRSNVCKRAEYPLLITSFRYRKCRLFVEQIRSLINHILKCQIIIPDNQWNFTICLWCS